MKTKCQPAPERGPILPLAPSRTRRVRRFIPHRQPGPGPIFDVSYSEAATLGGSVDLTLYLFIQRWAIRGWTEFTVAQIHFVPANPNDVYKTLLTGSTSTDVCDCRGFSSHGHCKHLDILRELAKAELI